MPLIPSRVKYRKMHRGNRAGTATRGNSVAFGEYGLQSLERCWLDTKQIEAARVAICLEQHPLSTPVALTELANQADVPARKARIVLALLKRHGLVREHRGGSWERLGSQLTSVNLSEDLHDYEERRAMDQAKLRAIIRYCQRKYDWTRRSSTR